jgi:bifunctional non-homologous end joining protein LigD
MGLAEYKRKRNFKATPEPAQGGTRGGGIFVVQLHHASHRHYDFRLELDGVLKSWAVPKGPSFDPAVKRLAMEVEDHPLSYATFEGDIPKGNYGAGHVDVFDHGTWEPIGSARQGLEKGDLKFLLHGDVLRGSWVLVRTPRGGTRNQWLLIKHRDEFAHDRDANDFVDAKTDRPISLARRRKTWPKSTGATNKASSGKTATKKVAAPPPLKKQPLKKQALEKQALEKIKDAAFAPELCRSKETPPLGDDWLHEVKWDGYRIVATVVDRQVRLWSRNGIEWTDKVPELARAVRSLRLKSAQLDGEMVVLKDGRDDFNTLQARLSAESKAPLLFVLFDMPHLNGRSLRRLPLIERKALLRDVLDKHPNDTLRFSEHQIGNGDKAFAQATKAGLEGIVSKRVDSAYSGTRSGDWIKVKCRPSDEFIVVGFTEPKGARAGLGALLLAQPRGGKLVYVGRVGTGIGGEELRALRKELHRTVIDAPVADIELMERPDRRLAIWVKPTLVVEAFFQGVGGGGLLRQPAFKTVRRDKTPKDIAEAKSPKRKSTEMKSSSGSKSKLPSLATKATRTKTPSRSSRSATNKASSARSGRAMPEATSRARTSARSASTSAQATRSAAPLRTARATKPASGEGGVTITHPERVVFPGTKITKGDVAAYYKAVMPALLQEIGSRPLAIVRCPDGAGKPCFFQKHLGNGFGSHVRGVEIAETTTRRTYLYVDDAQGLLELVQMNVLEFHPWGARVNDVEHADRIVFDLDPYKTVKWPRVAAGARMLRKQLASIGLESFVRTSGGKGLHVVVPLNPPAPWDKVKAFAQAVARAMATLQPKEFVAIAGEANRQDRIFVDWLRNGRGATAIGSYSLRARESAGVSMPIAWTELAKIKSGDAFTIRNAAERVARRKTDPWADIAKIKQRLPKIE